MPLLSHKRKHLDLYSECLIDCLFIRNLNVFRTNNDKMICFFFLWGEGGRILKFYVRMLKFIVTFCRKLVLHILQTLHTWQISDEFELKTLPYMVIANCHRALNVQFLIISLMLWQSIMASLICIGFICFYVFIVFMSLVCI